MSPLRWLACLFWASRRAPSPSKPGVKLTSISMPLSFPFPPPLRPYTTLDSSTLLQDTRQLWLQWAGLVNAVEQLEENCMSRAWLTKWRGRVGGEERQLPVGHSQGTLNVSCGRGGRKLFTFVCTCTLPIQPFQLPGLLHKADLAPRPSCGCLRGNAAPATPSVRHHPPLSPPKPQPT